MGKRAPETVMLIEEAYKDKRFNKFTTFICRNELIKRLKNWQRMSAKLPKHVCIIGS